jgi:hypothetical protein
MFAALTTVEPPIVEMEAAMLVERARSGLSSGCP